MMMEQLINILNNTKSIDGWLIEDISIESCELFFIFKNLDMNRRKNVRNTRLTIYKNYTEGGIHYKGSATTSLLPSMTEKEIAAEIEMAANISRVVKNPMYELVAPKEEDNKTFRNTFKIQDLTYSLSKLANCIYREESYDNCKISSCELFLDKIETRIINSLGIDQHFVLNKGLIELVVNCKGPSVDVEISDIINFSDFYPIKIRNNLIKIIEHARLRAAAIPLPAIKNIPVILRDKSVSKFLNYYYYQSSAMSAYHGYSTIDIGQSLYKTFKSGQRINMWLLPYVRNSVLSRYIDSDGIILHRTQIYKDGVLLCYHGDNRHSQYLGVPCTGVISNVFFAGGTKRLNKLKNGPYLELLRFSDFWVDVITGSFGGEVRLGIYYDGEKEIPVTGGSISGNIKDVQSDMLFSKEIQTIENYICPIAIKLIGVSISSA